MDLDRKEVLYIERAKNELDLAKAIFKLSTDTKLKSEFELKEDSTFFSNVISNSYYCIFYSAKALLQTKNITTEPPEEHRKTLNEFEKLTLSGEIDFELLKIYKEIVIKADELLGIFRKEKSKRGIFTYKKLPHANLEPAKESLNNAEKFFKNINLMLQNKGEIK
jgi:uncharacterized protein (UPF0332 family)|tara:strand:+ start:890 stop:1384 length:495 start_codon:yes stop_codon:yes gene_type:complete